MRNLFLFPLLIFFTFIVKSGNSQSIITDRPDQTESSVAVPKEAFQIETGLLVEHFNGFYNYREIAHPSTVFRYGLLKNFELRAVHSFNNKKVNHRYADFNSTGMADIELGAKFQFLGDETSTTHMSLLSHIVFPTGSTDFTENAYSSINKILVSHSFDFMTIGCNLGINYMNSEQYSYTYTFALSRSINDDFTIYIEPFGEIDHMDNHLSSISGGMAYLLNPKMQADFAFGTGINHGMNFFTLGFSVLITKDE